MASLHAMGGLLHQAPAPTSLVISLSRAACSTTASSSVGLAHSVPQFGGFRRVTHKTHVSPSSLKSSLFPLRSSPGVGFTSVSSPYPVGSKRGAVMPKGWLSKLGLGNGRAAQTDSANSPASGPDDDTPSAGLEFATFGAGCFWGPELAFQRVPGVNKTEVGYTQGVVHNPTYGHVCDGDTGHVEVVRVQYDPTKCSYESLLDAFWARHDPTTLNRQVRKSY
jgi:peptide-methionine (S)-S-oxide reductase